MGLFQKAYETYDKHRAYVGVYDSTLAEPLAPIAHITTAAQIEITVDQNGSFVSATLVKQKSKNKDDKDKNNCKIIIPITEESSGRTSGICPHPLCDQVGYISPNNPEKYDAYVEQLEKWCESEFTHPMLPPILAYVKGKTIMNDLAASGIDKVDEKNMICWVVVGLEENGGQCWTNKSLFEAFKKYYISQRTTEKSLCMVTGEETLGAAQHLKGVVAASGNAKLISSNDTTNFTYRGRFTADSQALTVGYEASQKAHNALKWIVATQSVVLGGRTFVCWNPEGKKIPNPLDQLRVGGNDNPAVTVAQYQKELSELLYSYRNTFSPADTAVIAVFDAATTGRLAVTYYNEMPATDFLDKLEVWDSTCVWSDNRFGIYSPSLIQIINCAFGTERGERIETDERVLKQQLQRLAVCRVEGAKMPYDIMVAIAKKTMQPLSYEKCLAKLQFTACAVIRKYYIDWKEEEYKMALEKDKNDISYQYGRLLAVMEKAERDTYDGNEGRETNAVRMQSAFCNHPLRTAKIVIEQLKSGYYPKLSQGSRIYYDRLIGEIYEKISQYPDSALNAPLKETYILGYYLQKNELYKKNENKDITEENEND